MQLHFCESRSVWLRVVRPLFCLNKSLFQVENSLAAMQSIFVQPPSFHLGCEIHHNCSLCFYCWNDQPVYICPLLSKTFHVVQCLWTSVVATCSFDSTAACVLFAFSTSRGTLLAGFQEVGGEGAREGFGSLPGSKHPSSSLLPSASTPRRNHHNSQSHPHFLPDQTSGKLWGIRRQQQAFEIWAEEQRDWKNSRAEELQLREHFGDGVAAIWCELIVS